MSVADKRNEYKALEREVRKKYKDLVDDLVFSELYDKWLEIHREVARRLLAGESKMTLRSELKTHNNADYLSFWFDYKERPEITLPGVTGASATQAEPEPEVIEQKFEYELKPAGRNHANDSDVYLVTFNDWPDLGERRNWDTSLEVAFPARLLVVDEHPDGRWIKERRVRVDKFTHWDKSESEDIFEAWCAGHQNRKLLMDDIQERIDNGRV